MNSVYLVYKTDRQHTYASRDLIGIATTKAISVRICKEQAKKEGESITEEQLFNLNNIKQTQGYSGSGEFQFEELSTNILL